MKFARVFLTPATRDKPGEVMEIEYAEQAEQYLEPLSYAGNDATRSSAEVQKEIDTVVASLPKLKGGARSKAATRVRILQRELRVSLDQEEADRRKLEREKERPRQRIGADSPFARQTQHVDVPAPPPPASPKSAASVKAGWEKHLADLDAWLVKRTLEKVRRDVETRAPSASPSTHSDPVCCVGRYLCPACQKKAAAGA